MADGKLLGHTDVVQYLILYGVILQKRSDFAHLCSFILPAHTDVSGKSTRLLKQHGTDAESRVGFCKFHAGATNVIAIVSLLARFNGHSLISKEVYFTFFMKQGRNKAQTVLRWGSCCFFFPSDLNAGLDARDPTILSLPVTIFITSLCNGGYS